MCGIVGMAGNLNSNHGKMFSDMLIFDAVRGKDSTGVVWVPMKRFHGQQAEPVLEKDVGMPDNLWNWGTSSIFDYKGYVNKMGRVYIGHNRAATVGKVTVENAHPFQFGNIFGVHNGSLRNYMDLEGYKELDVDSQCLFKTINERGIAHTWKNFTGAAALVWWDNEEQTLNIIRNDERPLYQGFSQNQQVMFWASEPWMIIEAAGRRNVPLLMTETEGGKKKVDIRYFTKDYHYRYEVTNTTVKPLGAVELEKKTYAPAKNTNSGGNYTVTKAGTDVGFRGPKQQSKVPVVHRRKKGKQLNVGWAGDMDRCDKDSRGLKFRLTHYLETGQKFMGRLLDGQGDYSGRIIVVYADSTRECELLKRELDTRPQSTFKTSARLRQKITDKCTSYGVSSRGIRLVMPATKEEPKNVIVQEQKAEPSGEEKYQGPPGYPLLDAKSWRDMLAQGVGGECCTYCGNPIALEDHKEIQWIGEHSALCKECVGDEAARIQIAMVYPSLDMSFWEERKKNAS